MILKAVAILSKSYRETEKLKQANEKVIAGDRELKTETSNIKTSNAWQRIITNDHVVIE